MFCWIDPQNSPWQNVPRPMWGRKADELDRVGREEYGVQLTGGDVHGVAAELSGTTVPRFLEWCAALPGALWQQHAPPLWSVALALLGVAWILAPRAVHAQQPRFLSRCNTISAGNLLRFPRRGRS